MLGVGPHSVYTGVGFGFVTFGGVGSRCLRLERLGNS